MSGLDRDPPQVGELGDASLAAKYREQTGEFFMTASDLLAQISAGAAPTVLDVRSRAEFLRGHVPGAQHIPFWKLLRQATRIPASLDDPLVVYCEHGPRARLAGAALRRRGFKQVEYLDGHMSQWRRAGLREET